MEKFFKARLKLTLFYSLILLLMSISLSGLYYQQTVGVINIHSQRINQRLEQSLSGDNSMRGPRMHGPVVRTELETARTKILRQIVTINSILLIFGVGASYFLSGRTLNPIRESLESQKQFVADAAHELKTPLTALKTSIEVSLVNKNLSKLAKEVLRDNLVEVKSLTRLSEDLLDLAQTENISQGDFSQIPLVDVIEEAVTRVRPLADQKQIMIEWAQASTKKELIILGNKGSLVKVLVILIDNAIKYSPTRTSVEIALRRKNNKAVLEVIDQGRGIPKKEQQNIFKRFYRIERSRSRAGEGGYGLGLSTARKIMEQHQGAINVESELGRGSRFVLSFGNLIS